MGQALTTLTSLYVWMPVWSHSKWSSLPFLTGIPLSYQTGRNDCKRSAHVFLSRCDGCFFLQFVKEIYASMLCISLRDFLCKVTSRIFRWQSCIRVLIRRAGRGDQRCNTLIERRAEWTKNVLQVRDSWANGCTVCVTDVLSGAPKSSICNPAKCHWLF